MLAISVGALVNAGLLLYLLIKHKRYQPSKGWLLFLIQIIGAALAMAAHLSFFTPRFDWIALQAEPIRRIMIGLFIIVSAASVYGAILIILGLDPRTYLKRGR